MKMLTAASTAPFSTARILLLALLAFDCGGNGTTDGGASGAPATTGGSSSASGGSVASSGGATATTGGSTTASGGVSSGMGGNPATGGTSPSTGGSVTSGGATSSTGGKSSTGGASSGGGAGASTGGTAGATAAGDYYISPTGLDSNPGTQAQPFLTLGKANLVAKAGTTIWVMPGTFKYSTTMTLDRKGTMAAPIKVWAVSGARPILDFSGQARGSSTARGIELKGDYFHIRGLEVMKAGDNGIAISGSYNTVEDVILHGNEDTGLQITVPSATVVDNSRGANNLILNCDSYENLDTATGGENADGFAAKLRIGAGNVFRGCRAWNNADDGWDLFAANDIVQIDNCWAFLNGKPSAGGNPAGDGNGFKLGGAPDATDPDQGGAVHVVTSSTAFDNLACGFVRNNNPSLPKLTTCGVNANGKGDYCSLTCTPSKTIQTTGAQAKTMARNADGTLPTIP